jgi:hypothetical protein
LAAPRKTPRRRVSYFPADERQRFAPAPGSLDGLTQISCLRRQHWLALGGVHCRRSDGRERNRTKSKQGEGRGDTGRHARNVIRRQSNYRRSVGVFKSRHAWAYLPIYILLRSQGALWRCRGSAEPTLLQPASVRTPATLSRCRGLAISGRPVRQIQRLSLSATGANEGRQPEPTPLPSSAGQIDARRSVLATADNRVHPRPRGAGSCRQ